MKRVIFAILLVLTMISSINVYAEDIDVYEIGANKYQIEKFAIRVYPLDEENEPKPLIFLAEL